MRRTTGGTQTSRATRPCNWTRLTFACGRCYVHTRRRVAPHAGLALGARSASTVAYSRVGPTPSRSAHLAMLTSIRPTRSRAATASCCLRGLLRRASGQHAQSQVDHLVRGRAQSGRQRWEQQGRGISRMARPSSISPASANLLYYDHSIPQRKLASISGYYCRL
jgi:hypothetical protein